MAKHVIVSQVGPMRARRKVADQNKEFHYHYSRNDPARVRDLVENYGYEVVRSGQAKVEGDAASLEGAVTAGGDVLVRCPIETWNARRKERHIRARNFRDGVREAFKSEAARQGVETVDLSKEKTGTMSSVIGANKN